MRGIFQLVIFLSAFLLFQVQPIIGRYILPWFGGAAGVWSVMMVFFQFVLLAGYGYAHLLVTRLAPRAQLAVHLGVLCAAALLLPVSPSESLKPGPGFEPVFSILILLGATVGLPFFAVSATAPLVQAWFARVYPDKSPYWLYALGNAGSLLALTTYPFVVEPLLGRHEQAAVWSLGFVVFAVLCVAAAVASLRRGGGRTTASSAASSDAPPERSRYAAWIALPALASALLLAFTNEICVDVASVPFLWILPLACYLLSFIVTFSGRWSGQKRVLSLLSPVALLCVSLLVFVPGIVEFPIQVVVSAYVISLFVLCCVVHDELYRLRPDSSNLTKFYFCVSIGGILGGLFVGIVCPLIFNSYVEIPLLFIFSFITIYYSFFGGSSFKKMHHFASIIVFSSVMVFGYYWNIDKFVHSSRNFYGIYGVQDVRFDSKYGIRSLFSGTTMHGSQFTDPAYQGVPTQYYSRHSGVGIALATLDGGPRKVGVIGLGVGTVAAYGRPGDTYRFYEINPDSLRIAQEYFSFLKGSRARVQVVLGDGRLSLEREESQEFDLLVLDAFTSDAIPVHLLTEEAFRTYLRHLRPDGGICVHISNRHLDLAPMLKSVARHMGLHALQWAAARDDSVAGMANMYVVLTPSGRFLERFDAMASFVRREFVPPDTRPGGFARRLDLDGVREARLWTDDFSNLFDALKPVFKGRE